ncbi:MAG: DUF5686 family protein [Rhodothermaceae bacterium]
MKKAVLFLLAGLIPLFAQNKFLISGKITNAKNNSSLPFANVKIIDKPIGTAADSDGVYQFNLTAGNYKLIYSYIGFTSDTISVELTKNVNINAELTPKDLQISDVTVTPGINPAIRLIERSIRQKQNRNSKIESYVFEAYTKGVVRSDKDVEGDSGGVNMSLFDDEEESDSADLKIVGIVENQSKGYFKSPDFYKDEIIARKQTANFPASLNVITGGRVIKNFYDEELNITGREIPSPIADYALDYYYYYIEDSLAYDTKKVFQIYFAPDDPNDPGFVGRLFILDETYDLVKVDVQINSAANPGGLFTEMNIYQQFIPFNGIYMPVDYRLFGEVDVMGIIKFGFEFNSILNRYEVNKKIQNSFFDMALVKIIEGADDKDSTYWQSIQTLPVSTEETKAYNKMDSLMNVPFNFWDEFSLLAFNYRLGKNYSITAPLGMYGFNKVEGHSISSEFSFSNLLDQRLWGNASVGYGFSDEKLKGKIGGRYLFGRLRTGEIEFNVYDKLTDLFGESIEYSKFTSTVLSLVSKQDFRDYYYTSGFDFKIKSELGSYLTAGIGFLNRTDRSAVNNTDFSFFNKDRKFDENKSIYETRINAITASLGLDFRKHIEDGYYKRRVSRGRDQIFFNGDVTFASKSLGSEIDFTIYKFNSYLYLNSFGATNLRLNIDAVYADKAVPYQMLYAVPGTISKVTQPYTFRSVKIGEAAGDRAVAANLIYDWQDDLFRAAGLTFLLDLDLTLSTHFNFVYLDISDESKAILPQEADTFRQSLMEAGFSIGQKIFPVSLDFTWRLNHRNKKKFVVGFSVPIL